MRAILRLILLSILLLPIGLIAIGWFALAEQALVLPAARLSHGDIARAKAILKKNDPRAPITGSRRSIEISEQDLNLAANYLLQKYTHGGARITMLPELVRISATARIPRLPFRPYLNLSLNLSSSDKGPQISTLRIGELDIPDSLAQWLVVEGLREAYQTRQYRLASDLIKDLQLDTGRIRISYEWRPELLDEVRSQLLSPSEQEAIAAYHAQLLKLQKQGTASRGSLTASLSELFRLAQTRSAKAGGDPVLENRSLLMVLGSWASGRGLQPLLPAELARKKIGAFRLSLERRRDFAQHFLTSAALVAGGDGALSNAVGLYKEMADADGGSGFSFTDIAADRAGTRFGEMATASAASARRLQQRMSRPVRETDIIPRIRDLPEHMNGAEFRRRFGGIDQPAYQQVMREIERRIDSCPLYQG